MTNESNLPVGRVALVAALICFLVYLRALFCGFAPMDDHIYVLNNPAIRSLDGNLFRWAFTAVPIDLWQPLSWLSLALDFRFWKLNPSGYHLTNILLHSANSALVVMIAGRLPARLTAHLRTGKPRYLYPFMLLLAGLLFGLHPLRVESVVWIAERKDVLSGLFFLGSIFFYLEHDSRTTSVAIFTEKYYLLSFGAFLLSLMAKPVCVVLPLMLLVLDWYPLERFKREGVTRVLAEKIPFLLLSTAIAALTLYFASVNQILKPYGFLTIGQRLIVSGNAIFDYCRLLLLPLGINPYQLITLPLPLPWLFKAVAAGIVGALIFARKRPWLTAVLGCFLLPLLPVLAIFQNGEQAMAARYTYLPSIAISIAVAVMLATLLGKLTYRGRSLSAKGLLSLIAAGILCYACMTFYLTGFWDNGESYWSRVAAMQPISRHYLALAEYHEKNGAFAAAIDNYTKAMEKATGDHRRYIYNLYAFRGAAYSSIGRYAEAVQDFSTAISLSPHPAYFYARGVALRQLGDEKAAAEDMKVAGDKAEMAFWYNDPPVEEIRRALELNPDDAESLNTRALMYLRMNDADRALQDLDRAIALRPERHEYYWNRSTALMKKGSLDRAKTDCNSVLQLKPDSVGAYLRRAFILAQGDDPAAALRDLDMAVRLDPENSEAFANRGLILFRLGRGSEAIADFTAALAKGPALPAVYYNRGLVYAALNKPTEADADLLRAHNLGYPLADAERRKIVSGKK